MCKSIIYEPLLVQVPINDMASNSPGIAVYPNPATKEITVNVKRLVKADLIMSIFDVQDKKFKAINYSNSCWFAE